MPLPTRTDVLTLDFTGAGQPAAYIEAKALSPSSATLDYTLAGQPVYGLSDGGTPTQNLAPALFTNANAFYTATVTRGAVNLAPALFTNTNTFYATTVSSAYTLSPALFTNTNTFYAAAVNSAYALLPARFDNTNAFYTATITPGAVNLAPALFTNTNAFYSATVNAGAVTLSPALFINTNVFYSATVSSGGILAGGGGEDERKTKSQRKKKKKVVYQVDNRLFETAAAAAAYAASLEPQTVETAVDTPKQRSILSTVKIDDKELDVETLIPAKATKEFVADLVRAEMKKALRQIKLANDREELEVVSIIAQMLFSDDVTIYTDVVPPTTQFG
jgi:hypothetical protein